MLVSDFLERLGLGELSQHRYSDAAGVKAEHVTAVLAQLNTAMLTLYGEFPLREKEILIRELDHRTDYPILTKHADTYAVTGEEVSVDRFIADSVANPFTGDVLRFEAMYDAVGTPLPMNDEHASDSINTVAWDTLQIPYPVEGRISALIYRARPGKVDPAGVLDVPAVLEEALAAAVASRCYVSLGNAASAGLATYYDQRYQEQVARAKRENLLNVSESDSNIRFMQKGLI